MTTIKHPRTAAALVLGVLVALAALAGPASARWYGDNDRDDHRWQNNDRYYGYHYREPPVIYTQPTYRYYPPPVYYDATPGFTIHLGG